MKARNDSIYGLWSDLSGMVEFKISPMGQYTRIKIMDVTDMLVLNKISVYCGLKFIPKRANWKGFDFVTHLERITECSYKSGSVHMPRATRKTVAELTVLDSTRIILDFNFTEPNTDVTRYFHAGSITLEKKAELVPDEANGLALP
jgi:hypothetical protein